MTEQFKKYVDMLAKGLNFPENVVILSVGINDGEKLHMGTVIGGNNAYVGMLVDHVLRKYIKSVREDEGVELAAAYAEEFRASLDKALKEESEVAE